MDEESVPVTEGKEDGRVTATDEMKEEAVRIGQEVFKKLIELVPATTKEEVFTLVNASIYLMCCVQNSFYLWEARDKFADDMAEVMKKNKWNPPASESPKAA